MKKKVNKYIILMVATFFIGSLFPFAYSGVNSGLEEMKIMVDVVDKIKVNYVEEKENKELLENALTGMVRGLDEFSDFIVKKEMKPMREETRGEFGGVGMRLDASKKDRLIVVTPMPDTPAYKAGIEPNDEILKIDDKLVKDMKNSDEAVEALRGLVGTKVKVLIERTGKNGKKEQKTFTLRRARIIPQVVFPRMLNEEIGYIYVQDFSGHTTQDFQNALQDLSKKGMKALVLDLRFNPGGLLDSAVDMVKMFVGENKLIVYTKGRNPEYFKEYKSVSKAKYEDLPIVLLVNEMSASGSEIVAGALQDHKRAFLIGARTFGKGSVQQIMSLEGGAGLRLTVARYYTPLGRMIHKNFKAKNPDETGGILPDMEVDFKLNEERKATMYMTNLLYSPSQKTSYPEENFNVKDIVLERALEILKARKSLAALAELSNEQKELKEQDLKTKEEEEKQKQAV